jgi:hypothetical protein
LAALVHLEPGLLEGFQDPLGELAAGIVRRELLEDRAHRMRLRVTASRSRIRADHEASGDPREHVLVLFGPVMASPLCRQAMVDRPVVAIELLLGSHHRLARQHRFL